ncbi:CsgG/HfaB family protein [Candidatus Scalindua japonica]|uniref:CsgG/HfaB family protein n=1 Tax=Candidatus Scalindua japonica TaxID=1284222 RepID=UPI000BDE799D|nr:CsgG/HfaB family protein [Candidatus Scalindua japonica]
MKSFNITSTIPVLIFIILCLTGCESTDTVDDLFYYNNTKNFDNINFHKSEEYVNTRLKRVLLLPFTIKTHRDKVVNEVTNAFYIELQKSAKFDILVPQGFQDILSQQQDIWNRGLIRAETIVEAKKRYKVDAIIFGTITQYHPYEPPILGIKVGMFSANSGNIMWSSDAIFDSSEASVIKLIKTYHREHYQKHQSLYDWKIIPLSTKRYAQFVAHYMVESLKSKKTLWETFFHSTR